MRVERLDDWSEKANSQITALQGLINRAPIHIYNGEDGKDDLVPIIGVETGADGTDGADGASGTTPTINVAAYDGANTNFTGKLCWKINGKFLLVGGNNKKVISKSSHQFTINGMGTYTAIKAEITSGAGIVSDVAVTRSSTTVAPWSVKIGSKVDGADNTWSSTCDS